MASVQTWTTSHALDFDAAVLQVQDLREIRRPDKRVRRQLNAHAAELDQLAQFRPRIRLGHEQHQVSVLLRPDVGGQVAIAKRHGIIFILSERCPGHVVFANGVTATGNIQCLEPSGTKNKNQQRCDPFHGVPIMEHCPQR